VGLISDTDFLRQQAYLGSGFASLENVHSYVQSGLVLVVDSVDVDVEIDMIGGYTEDFNSTEEINTASSLLRKATVALQRHVETRSGQTFNDYLYLRGLKVSTKFAELSAIVGQEINPVNIQG
jgi:hypothetical protein